MGGRFIPDRNNPASEHPCSKRAYNSMESPPVYCYARQAEDVLRLCRLLHVMSPVREVSTKEMIRCGEFKFPHPIFFYVLNHPWSVPLDFWPYLRANHAIIVELEFS